MTGRRMSWASGAVALALAAVAAIALRRLPPGATLPTHWNAAGVVDGTAPAATALFLPVVVSLALSAVFAALPRLEPLQHRLERSAALLNTAWATLLALMVVVEAMIAGPAFGIHPPATLVLVAVGVMLIVIGNALPKSRPGFFVGIRTPWTIIDPDNWIATHRLGAWTFIAGGAVMIAAALLPIGAAARQVLVMAAGIGAALPPIAWSWWLWHVQAARSGSAG